jgi:ANTAR domain
VHDLADEGQFTILEAEDHEGFGLEHPGSQEAFEHSTPETDGSSNDFEDGGLWVSETPISLGFAESKDAESANSSELARHLILGCSTVVHGADCSLTVVPQGGKAELVAASSTRVRSLDRYQLELGEGPLVDALTTQITIVNWNLRGGGDRWPRYTSLSIAVGYKTIHVFAMAGVGALAISDSTDNHVGMSDINLLQSIIGIVSIGMTHGGRLNAARELARQLQHALDSRVIIEQAKGIVSVWLGVQTEDAFNLLRRHARNKHIRLADLALAIVQGDIDESHVRIWMRDEPSLARQLRAPVR